MNLFENIEKLINNHNVENKIDKEQIKSKDVNLSEDEIDLANKLAYSVVKNKYLDTDISQMIPEDFDFDKLI